MLITVPSSVFDLDTMDEVSLVKTKEFNPASNAKQVMDDFCKGDAEKFLNLLNAGLLQSEKQALKSDTTIPWLVQDEDGKPTTPFTGTPANSKAVNTLVLTLAKTIVGYTKDAPLETKRAAKESSLEMVRGNEAMKAGLKRSAVADSE